MDVPAPPPLSETERLAASLDITNALLSAISTTDPLPALVSRISALCHGTAIVYDFEGSVVASTGEAPIQLIWNEIAQTNRRELDVPIGRWRVLTRRVSLRDSVHVIALASRTPETLVRLGEILLDTSERLLGAVHGIQYGASRRDRRDNEQLLASLHDGVLPAREHRFWARLAQFRFPAYASVRALELAPFDGLSATEAHLDHLAQRARAEELPLLVMLRRADADAPATLAALVPESDASARWIDSLTRTLLVGASAPFAELTRVADSAREAETALGIARRWAASAEAPSFLEPTRMDRIDLATWALANVDPRQLEQRTAAALDPIRSPQLRETLAVYLAAEQSIARTAEQLFVHPNTVRYRLGRIEAAIGAPIASAFAVTNLTLALHADLIGRRASGPAPVTG